MLVCYFTSEWIETQNLFNLLSYDYFLVYLLYGSNFFFSISAKKNFKY